MLDQSTAAGRQKGVVVAKTNNRRIKQIIATCIRLDKLDGADRQARHRPSRRRVEVGSAYSPRRRRSRRAAAPGPQRAHLSLSPGRRQLPLTAGSAAATAGDRLQPRASAAAPGPCALQASRAAAAGSAASGAAAPEAQATAAAAPAPTRSPGPGLSWADCRQQERLGSVPRAP